MSEAVTKSTVEAIRARFEKDVERFSNLETRQTATIDAPLVLELITTSAAATTPAARDVVDVGCGAGNYTLKLLERLPHLNAMLVDLSQNMLDRAAQRVGAATGGKVKALAGDIREIPLGDGSMDIILAAAVLHHLRTDAEWELVLRKFHRCLRPGGSIWIADLVAHEMPAIQRKMWDGYGDYLSRLGGPDYREKVFAYVEAEDTPRSLTYQINLLQRVGFGPVEVLHKHNCFAAFGAIRK
jgi:tRNA (cmo5U34)-methyltransferase